MAKPTATPKATINAALNQIQQQEATQPQISVPSAPRSQWDTFIKPFEGQISQTMISVLAIAVVLIANNIVQPWVIRQSYRISFSKRQEKEIDQILIELRILTNCDRILLTLFTNGINTISGQSIKGCVVTHEITDIGVTQVGGIVNNRLNGYSHFILKSLTDTPFRKRIAEEIIDNSYRAFAEEIQAVLSVNYFLSANDLPLGFLSFHWRSSNNQMDFEAVSQEEIRKYADKITSRLISSQNLVSKVKALWVKK